MRVEDLYRQGQAVLPDKKSCVGYNQLLSSELFSEGTRSGPLQQRKGDKQKYYVQSYLVRCCQETEWSTPLLWNL